MYKVEWKKEIPLLSIILFMVIMTFIIYPHLPKRLPIHWNIKGEIDGYANKSWINAFLFPLLTFGLYLLLLFIPYIDPNKDKYEQFIKVYYIIRLANILFFFALYVIIMLSSLGYPLSVSKIILVCTGLLFFVLGNFMGKIRQNWFVGIKLPWTLASEKVWNKTHRLGGYLFMITGLSCMISVFFKSEYILIFLFVPLFSMLLVTSIYSYRLYKIEKREGRIK